MAIGFRETELSRRADGTARAVLVFRDSYEELQVFILFWGTTDGPHRGLGTCG